MNEHCAVSVDEICELDEVYRQCHIGGGGATMRDPVFTQTMQIGIVVRDLGATMRKYVDEYGSVRGRSTNLTPATRRICANTASRSSAPGAW